MRKIKTGDHVIVLAGNDKGKRGKVLRVLDEGKRLVVEGVRMIKKHVKQNPRTNQPGGIVEKEASLDASNVAIFNSQSNKADRVGFKEVDGKKRRVFKSTGELIDL